MSVIIIAVVITTVMLMDGGLGQDREPTAEEATDRGASLFTDDGLRYIDRTREIKLDLRNVPLEAAALGLPEEGDVTIRQETWPVGVVLPYTVSLRTPSGSGVTKIKVSEATLTTSAGQLTEVRSEAAATGAGFKGALDLVREQAEEFGYTVDTETINAEMGDAVRAGKPYSHTVGPGEALGAKTVVELTCEEPMACTVVFRITPGMG
jgi:hypothetical protein